MYSDSSASLDSLASCSSPPPPVAGFPRAFQTEEGSLTKRAELRGLGLEDIDETGGIDDQILVVEEEEKVDECSKEDGHGVEASFDDDDDSGRGRVEEESCEVDVC